MTVFIELITDPFASTFEKNIETANRRRRAGVDRVRRPTRGLEIKDDTYAIMKLIKSNGEEVKLVDSGDPTGESTQYSNFILQSVSEARMEKHQIVETFGEPYVFFFGEQPRFLDVTAVLVDSFDFNWYAEWWENYNRYLRGTRSVEMGARTYLFYDDNIVEGYMLQAQSSKVSETPLMVGLSFRLFLTSYTNVTLVNVSGGYPTRPGAGLPNLQLQPIPGASSDPTSLTSALRDLQLTGGSVTQQLGIFNTLAQQAGLDGVSDRLSDARTGIGALSDFTGLLANTAGALSDVVDAASPFFGGGEKNPLPKNSIRSRPLRGNIADNDDEFTSPYPFSTAPPLDKRATSFLEDAANLASRTINAVREVGAVVSNAPGLIKALGLQPAPPPAPRTIAAPTVASGLRSRSTREPTDKPAGRFASASSDGDFR